MDSWVLAPSRLSELLVLAQPYPLEAQAVEELARHWVGVAALARRFEAGDSLAGEEAFRASMWLERREALLELDREDRLGAVAVVSPEPAFRNGTYRLFAHVVRRAGPGSSDEERALQRRTAERILAELVAGGSWDAAVAESEDADTRESAGLLGLFARGELPPPLDRVAFRLEPGQVSAVVESEQGFHIVYRPRFVDVRDLYASRLRERRLQLAEAEAAEGLLERRGYAPRPDVAERVRSLAAHPLRRLGSAEELASWEGGALPEGTVARYVVALDAPSRAELSTASEEAVAVFVDELALRELRIRDAEQRGLRLDAAALAGLRRQHEDEVRAWTSALGLEDRATSGREAVGRYMEALVSRRVDTRSLAPLYEAWLLGRVEWSVSEAELRGAAEQARAMIQGVG